MVRNRKSADVIKRRIGFSILFNVEAINPLSLIHISEPTRPY